MSLSALMAKTTGPVCWFASGKNHPITVGDGVIFCVNESILKMAGHSRTVPV